MSDWSTIQALTVLIPALPLIAALLTWVLGPRILKSQSHWPTIVALLAAFGASLTLLQEVRVQASRSDVSHSSSAVGYAETVKLWTWAQVPDALSEQSSSEFVQSASGETQFEPAAANSSLPFDISIVLRADGLTSIMLCMVTFIASLVAIYSKGYMHGDDGYWRFFTYVSLFVFSMCMLVSVSNFALLYVFWEAVGACSYLLIGFWYRKPEAAAAGKKAFLVNRVGDFGFAIGIFLLWMAYGSLNYHDTSIPGVLGSQRLAGDLPFVEGGLGIAIALCLFVGACGKSAQFPLHVWLPDAMEGPTPVSALIHAATMVTAGVYLVVRCAPLFLIDGAGFIDPHVVVACIGGITALMAGFIAMTQNDLKRVLAYSTVSQLGYMFLAVGTGSLVGIVAGMFHLFTHAFFKALLFLGAGSVMHAMGGVIDMRRFGGLRKLMPITHWTFLFGSLALAGVPIWAGFFSKDAVLAAAYEQAHTGGTYDATFAILSYGGFVAAFLTAVYTFRAYFLTFFGPKIIPDEAGHHAHESPLSMAGPLCLLAVMTLLVGWVFGGPSSEEGGFRSLITTTPSLASLEIGSSETVHADAGDHGQATSVAGKNATTEAAHGAQHHIDHERVHTLVAVVSVCLAVGGILLAAFLYLGDSREADLLARWLWPLAALSRGKLFIDEIYQWFIVRPLRLLAGICALFDQYLVDGLVDTIGKIPIAVARVFRSMQTGLVQTYALLMVLGLLTLLASVLWRTG